MIQRTGSMRIGLLIFIFVIAQLGFIVSNPSAVKAANNGLALKPLMGWSSYSLQVYHNGRVRSGGELKAQSDAMHTTLQSHGYKYINVDAGWNGGIDGYGGSDSEHDAVSSGLQDLIDYVHANGQKFGLYGYRGYRRRRTTTDLPISALRAARCRISPFFLYDGGLLGAGLQDRLHESLRAEVYRFDRGSYAGLGSRLREVRQRDPGLGS